MKEFEAYDLSRLRIGYNIDNIHGRIEFNYYVSYFYGEIEKKAIIEKLINKGKIKLKE